MSEIGRPGQHVDVFHGGDIGADGRLLTIAEIAEELRRLHAGTGTGADLSPETATARLRLAASRSSGWRGRTRTPSQAALFPAAALALSAEPARSAPLQPPADVPAGAESEGAESPPSAGEGRPPTGEPAGRGAPENPRISGPGSGRGAPTSGPTSPPNSAVAGRGASPRADQGAPPPAPARAPLAPDRARLATGWPAAGQAAAGTATVAAGTPARLRLDPGWTVVVAAHAGAGATSVAVAVADAAALAGRGAHLLDTARPSRSGLVAVSSRELGLLDGGLWRRGLRDGVTVDRPASDRPPTGWPELPAPPLWHPAAGAAHRAPLTVLDLGLPTAGPLSRLAEAGCPTVVVARCTVPGVRAVEHTLSGLQGSPAIVALLGPARWPSEATASTGPLLRAARQDGRVVGVRLDRRLEATGLTAGRLPRSLIVAGRDLLEHLAGTHPVRSVSGATGTSGATGAPTERNT